MKRTVIDDLIDNFKRLDIGEVASQSITSATLNDAVDLNIQQLNDSELNNTEQVGNYAKATESYNDYRSTKVSSSERIKFYDTGQFHRSIKASINKKGELKFNSNSRKLPRLNAYLEDKGYTGGLLGLNEEKLASFLDFFKQDVVNGINKKLLK